MLQAIAALGKALQADPGNPEVLLSLGVSHTNELDQSRALTYLMEWLKAQPGQSGAAAVQLPTDARERLRVVVDIFQTAAQMVDKLPSRRVAYSRTMQTMSRMLSQPQVSHRSKQPTCFAAVTSAWSTVLLSVSTIEGLIDAMCHAYVFKREHAVTDCNPDS